LKIGVVAGIRWTKRLISKDLDSKYWEQKYWTQKVSNISFPKNNHTGVGVLGILTSKMTRKRR
jgi:hypothetical protein